MTEVQLSKLVSLFQCERVAAEIICLFCFSVTEVQLSEFVVPEDDFGETSIETNHVSIFR